MGITDYHAKYLAHELTRRCASDNVEKLAPVLADAQVDLNPHQVLETTSFNAAVRGGNLNPFQQNAIVLCSYQFARTKDAYVRQTPWDLIVIDEAHRLRNVELKARLAPLCKRTLRRQVLQYVKYTNRHALVQEFVPSTDEQRLYDLVSEYLQRDSLYALPASQRQLVTLRRGFDAAEFRGRVMLFNGTNNDPTTTSIRKARKVARAAPTLPEKLAGHEIAHKKDTLLDEVVRRLEQAASATPLFTLRWRLT